MITCHSEVTCTLSHAPNLRLFFCDARNGKCFFFQRYFSNLHLRGEGWRWTRHGFRRCSAWLATTHSERKSWCPLLLATKELYGFLCLAQGQHIGLSALKLGEFVLGLSSYFNHLIGQEGGEKKQCGDVTLASQPFRLPPLRRRRRIISLRLFGAAPVFSCVAALIQTWCIAGLQTMV